MAERSDLHQLIDQLPASEIEPAERYLRYLLGREEAPLDADMLARIDAARATPSAGIPHEEILREFGL